VRPGSESSIDAGVIVACRDIPGDPVTDLNPQMKQMADESMVRNLDAQARAIWPQEMPLIRRYGLADDIRILDAGCGTGEAASRLAQLFPRSTVLGVDILDHHLELARDRYRALAPRLGFEHRSIYELGLPDKSFDLTVCRHVVHSIPQPERVYAELARVTKSGGRLHLIPEDYGMLHFERGPADPREMWHYGPAEFGEKTETDLYIGRHSYGILKRLGLEDVGVDFVIVDTLRVPRETFAGIIGAWKDGYVEGIAEKTRFSEPQVAAYFDAMLENIRDPNRYAAWFVPVVSARVP
jgi:SAM-dependent methyltransferase